MGTGGPALVTSDAAILKRAIAHLLTNAAKVEKIHTDRERDAGTFMRVCLVLCLV